MGRVDAMRSTPVSNVIFHDQSARDRHLTWIMASGQAANTLHLSGREYVQRVLGRQDFCWTGNVRHWIWVRSFQVDFGGGRVETWHWRLFASRRGLTLEVEDKYRRPFGDAIRKAGVQALDDFIKVWGEE